MKFQKSLAFLIAVLICKISYAKAATLPPEEIFSASGKVALEKLINLKKKYGENLEPSKLPANVQCELMAANAFLPFSDAKLRKQLIHTQAPMTAGSVMVGDTAGNVENEFKIGFMEGTEEPTVFSANRLAPKWAMRVVTSGSLKGMYIVTDKCFFTLKFSRPHLELTSKAN